MSEDEKTIEVDDPTPEKLIHLGLLLADEGSLPVVVPIETVEKITEE